MKDKIKYIIFIIFFMLWVGIWFRNFYKDISANLHETRQLCGKSVQEKWEYVFGPELYRYLSACKELIPHDENIFFVHDLDAYIKIRALYFLYPRTTSNNASFVMVYKHPFTRSDNDKLVYYQSQDILIIKR